jgi:hypothetical protein
VTIAAFLETCAARFDAANDRHMACQCRSYSMIALNIEHADRERRGENAPAKAAPERAKRAKKRPELPPYTP